MSHINNIDRKFHNNFFQDWDNTVSTPLVGKGSPAPNIISPCDKHSTSENSNGYITFAVEGDPAPEVQWFKVQFFSFKGGGGGKGVFHPPKKKT